MDLESRPTFVEIFCDFSFKFQISNFNWPGLGRNGSDGRNGTGVPQPWLIEIWKISSRSNAGSQKYTPKEVHPLHVKKPWKVHPWAEIYQKDPQISKKIRTFLEVSKRIPMHWNASDCIRTHPNTSERVRTRSKTSEKVRNFAKASRNFAKTSRLRG